MESFIDFKDKFKARDIGLRALLEEKYVCTNFIQIKDYPTQIPEEVIPEIEELMLLVPDNEFDTEYLEECKLPENKSTVKRSSGKKTEFPCDYCTEVYPSFAELDVHKDIAHLQCPVCLRTYRTHRIMKHHKRNLHAARSYRSKKSKREFACDYCTDVYQTWSEMDQHKEIAHLECPECLNTYRSHRVMKNHRKKVHITNCDICGKQVANQLMLTKHMSDFHDTERKHKCDVCGKGFDKLESLKRHMDIHNPVNHVYSEICDFANCGKVYKTVSSLNAHKKTHFDW